MELIERAGPLAVLQTKFENVAEGEGHCILLSGEAGIGKTSLIKAFCSERKNDCRIYQGTCDALFTPRPLAPLYDIAWQMQSDLLQNGSNVTDRAGLFARFLRELNDQKGTSIIIFEDIHWADEATLDFIKFLARRITQVHCLFILTYRNEEVHSGHALRNVLGQLSPDSFTRLQLVPLSKEAVERLAEERGYSGENVYSISGGNPFYVNEILASYSPGIPDNIKDSVLSVYHRQDEKTQRVWEILSVLPTGFEVKYLERMEPLYADAIKYCLDSKILIIEEGYISFKHELYRRTIEASLSPLVRVSLNKKILDLFLEYFEQADETERIIHHAKNANEHELVVQYVPVAAKKAACLGAHIEASKLYYSAIEYYQGSNKDLLIEFYEPYAYECYLTRKVKEAIIYQTKSLNIWKEKNATEKIGNSLRFLSRLWWFEGNRNKAESYASQAIEVLNDQSSSRVKAMSFSNMSQLKMLSGEFEDCLCWGEKAIAIAEELADDEILSHALNNVGSVQMEIPSSRQKGIKILQQSLELALKNSFHEHAARAHINLASSSIKMKDYVFAKQALEEGISYAEKRDLDSWTPYMLSLKARLCLETGLWDEACSIASNLVKNEDQASVVKIGALAVLAKIKMRRGDTDVLSLMMEAKAKAFEAMELQRIIPALVSLLEYEWISGVNLIEKADLDQTISMVQQMGNVCENSEFAFWLLKARKQQVKLREFYEGYRMPNKTMALKAAVLWENLGCPYEQALALFEGNTIDKQKAITIIHALGADAIYKKMKLEMRSSGIRNIPRGKRKTTRSNPAHLTERELDVLQLLKAGLQNKEIADRLFISAKTVDHHISSILFKLDVNSRAKAVHEAISMGI